MPQSLTTFQHLRIKNGNSRDQHIPTKWFQQGSHHKCYFSIKKETGKIFTLISLLALPTERKLLFTCSKYRKNRVFNNNQRWMQKKKKIFTYIKYQNPNKNITHIMEKSKQVTDENLSFTGYDGEGNILQTKFPPPFPHHYLILCTSIFSFR